MDTLSVDKPLRPDLSHFLLSYDSLFRTQLDSTRCPGTAIAIVQDSDVIFLKTYGLKSTADQDSIGPHTRFRLGSLSKGFAGIIAAQMVDQGLLGLNERVIDILPTFGLSDTAQTARIRVWHILSHSCGLPRHTYTSRLEGGEPRDSILAALRTVQLGGLEGEFFAYQNFAFSLIEDIVAKRLGKPYGQVIKEQLFSPVGMQDALIDDRTWSRCRDRALPHYQDRKGNFVPKALNGKYFDYPSAGGVCASITDMAHWLRLLLGQYPSVVSASALDTTFAPRVATHSRSFAHRWEGSKGSYYGLGWRIIDMGDHRIICHGGTVNQYRSEIAIDPQQGLGICFLFNAPAEHQGSAPAQFFRLYRTYLRCGLGAMFASQP